MYGVRVLCVVGAILGSAGSARAGFLTVNVWAGPGGSAVPSPGGTFGFTFSSDSPLVAVDQVPAGGTLRATTGGGTAFFNVGGVPVVLNVSDGSAYLASSTAPAGAVPASGLASAAPAAGGVPPSGSTLLSVGLSDLFGNVRLLAATVTDGTGLLLGPGMGQVAVPDGGWWVIGLTPGSATFPPIDAGAGNGGAGGSSGGSPGASQQPSAATPEPATVALVGLGLSLVGVRSLRRKP